MEQKKHDLEERFIDFHCIMIDVVEALPKTRTGGFLAEQLVKASHSPAINYNNAQSSASRKDFIGKMSILLNELKGCRTALKIISKKQLIKPAAKLENSLVETEALIAIVGKSISTARKNQAAGRLKAEQD